MYLFFDSHHKLLFIKVFIREGPLYFISIDWRCHITYQWCSSTFHELSLSLNHLMRPTICRSFLDYFKIHWILLIRIKSVMGNIVFLLLYHPVRSNPYLWIWRCPYLFLNFPFNIKNNIIILWGVPLVEGLCNKIIIYGLLNSCLIAVWKFSQVTAIANDLFAIPWNIIWILTMIKRFVNLNHHWAVFLGFINVSDWLISW